MEHLTSAPPAALVLCLVLVSFHSACWAEASRGNGSTVTDHHPDAETLEQCHGWFPVSLASTGSGYLAKVQGEAHQLWKLCTAVCFWESRRSSSRMALMSEAEEWPGCRSSVELAA
ncbi:transmembrane protein 213 [Phyllostomus discolor]|uniref:Transmembrane protein 213 n=1 Tax=Phyllostomus discolor TaxID=89673 RepID=A0A834DNU6_9CHIR|nr:transmembrane protein 213 [Phyllostomus discolor]